MHDGQQLGAGTKQRRQLVQHQLAGIGDRHHAQPGTLLLAEHLPRDDVGVVLHRRDDHLVTVAHLLTAKRLRHEIDALRGVARKDDLGRFGGIEKTGHLPACALVRVGRPLAQRIHATMDVRVLRGVVSRQRLEHRARLLGGGRIVEIGERLVADPLGENRKQLADPSDVERPVGDRGVRVCHARCCHVSVTSTSR